MDPSDTNGGFIFHLRHSVSDVFQKNLTQRRAGLFLESPVGVLLLAAAQFSRSKNVSACFPSESLAAAPGSGSWTQTVIFATLDVNKVPTLINPSSFIFIMSAWNQNPPPRSRQQPSSAKVTTAAAELVSSSNLKIPSPRSWRHGVVSSVQDPPAPGPRGDSSDPSTGPVRSTSPAQFVLGCVVAPPVLSRAADFCNLRYPIMHLPKDQHHWPGRSASTSSRTRPDLRPEYRDNRACVWI